MNLHPDVAFWDIGVLSVPQKTGALNALDALDLRRVLTDLGVSFPLSSVLDVGCGTGRLSVLAERYRGLDIAPSAVTYCQQRGLDAHLISGAEGLAAHQGFDWTALISVFTHLGPDERAAYLRAFTSPHVLLDVFAGDGTGDVSHWTTDIPALVRDLSDVGYRVRRQETWTWPDPYPLEHVLIYATRRTE